MWTASAGFYWSANPGEGILGDGTGNSTLAQLIWSADNVADYANAYNLHFVSGDDVWLADLIITENGIPGDEDDYAYFTAPIFDDGGAIGTGGYIYARIFQDTTVGVGEWYFAGSMVLAEDVDPVATPPSVPQSYQLNSDTVNGNAIDSFSPPTGDTVVPEPTTWALFALGATLLGFVRRRRFLGLGTLSGVLLLFACAATATEFGITSIERSGSPGEVILTWTTSTGHTYDVEIVTDLSGGGWTDLDGATNLPGTNGTLSVYASVPATGRYFRVREDDTILGTNAAGARLFSAAAIDLYGMTLDPAADASLESWIGDQLPQGSVAYLWDRESNGYIVHSRGRGGWTGGSLYRGDALWLRPESATDFLLVGFVPDVETTILHLSPGDFVAYPFPADLVWTNSQAAQQASWGDVIYVWNDKYDGYSKGRGGWSTPEGFVISNASAFWFKTSTVTNWTEPVPYDWQLD